MNATVLLSDAPSFEIRFASLFDAGRAMVFPCDERGHVDLDALSERARENYLFARAMVGKDYSPPFLQRHTDLANTPPQAAGPVAALRVVAAESREAASAFALA